MEQPKEKKTWVTPELIVLVRRRPGEAVLVTCKPPSLNADPVPNWITKVS